MITALLWYALVTAVLALLLGMITVAQHVRRRLVRPSRPHHVVERPRSLRVEDLRTAAPAERAA